MRDAIIHIGQVGITFLLKAPDTDGSLAMFEFTVPVGAKVPMPHFHKEYDGTIYGVEGVITLMVDGETVDIGPGNSCFIPRGVAHGFSNINQMDAKALAVVTPALIGPNFFREMAAILSAGGPPDAEKIKSVMAAHGLVAVMPKVS